MDQGLGVDDVEGQHPGWPVQVHSDPVGGRGRGADGRRCTVVADGVTTSVAVESPGLVVLSKLAVSVVALPPDASVTDRDEGPSLTLHLPVAATGQAVPAQHLWPPVESVWVLGVGLLLLREQGCPLVLRQMELFVQRVGVKGQVAAVWGTEDKVRRRS